MAFIDAIKITQESGDVSPEYNIYPYVNFVTLESDSTTGHLKPKETVELNFNKTFILHAVIPNGYTVRNPKIELAENIVYNIALTKPISTEKNWNELSITLPAYQEVPRFASNKVYDFLCYKETNSGKNLYIAILLNNSNEYVLSSATYNQSNPIDFNEIVNAGIYYMEGAWAKRTSPTVLSSGVKAFQSAPFIMNSTSKYTSTGTAVYGNLEVIRERNSTNNYVSQIYRGRAVTGGNYKSYTDNSDLCKVCTRHIISLDNKYLISNWRMLSAESVEVDED